MMRRFIIISLLVHTTLLITWNMSAPVVLPAEKRLSIDLITAPSHNTTASATACCKIAGNIAPQPVASEPKAPHALAAAVPLAPPESSRLLKRTRNRVTHVSAEAGAQQLEKRQVDHAVSPVAHTIQRTLPATAINTNTRASDNNLSVSQGNTDTLPVSLKLRSRIMLALREHFSYPVLARRYGWQGLVEMRLRIEADGRLSHIELARSSGYATLDQAALNSTRRINTLHEAATWLRGSYMDLSLPVEYRLIDG